MKKIKDKKFVLYNGNNNGPYKKPFSKDWNGLKKWLEAKLWNLHIEEKRFQDSKKKSKDDVDDVYKWTQQLGKIIFISGTLNMFFETFGRENKISKKVWKERGWKLKNGKIIINGNKKHKN